MTDKLEATINRAQQAEMLLNHPLLQEAFTKLDEQYVAAWRTAPVKDTEGRERLWQAVNLIGKVREHLHKILDSGKLAKVQLNELLRSQR